MTPTQSHFKDSTKGSNCFWAPPDHPKEPKRMTLRLFTWLLSRISKIWYVGGNMRYSYVGMPITRPLVRQADASTKEACSLGTSCILTVKPSSSSVFLIMGTSAAVLPYMLLHTKVTSASAGPFISSANVLYSSIILAGSFLHTIPWLGATIRISSPAHFL